MSTPDEKTQLERIHSEAQERLAVSSQRYTDGRKQLVKALFGAHGPMAMPAILSAVKDMPQSSAYRHLTVLVASGVVQRVAGNDELGLFELTEELSGAHHHHVVCSQCGRVVDVSSSSDLEQALVKAASIAAAETGFQIDAHRIDMMGTCPSCSEV